MSNMSSIDRVVRVLAGLVLLSLYFVGPRTAWGLVGFVPLLTGVVGFCPVYRLFGFSSCASSHPN